jgi:hypothetical protein
MECVGGNWEWKTGINYVLVFVEGGCRKWQFLGIPHFFIINENRTRCLFITPLSLIN